MRVPMPLALVLLLPLSQCGQSTAPSPFGRLPGGASGAAGAGEGAAVVGGGSGGADTVREPGRPCLDDAQCDDGFDCTRDRCDIGIERCRHEPAHARCRDDDYCNGEERCDVRLGCVSGDPRACSDGITCTIDRCVEETKSCEHEVRDADGDGDGDGNCLGGGDCNDFDAAVSSLATEVCANARDDDCDGERDETDCEKPLHDTCRDPLEIRVSGTYQLPNDSAAANYPASCSASTWRDTVAAVIVEDEPVRLDAVGEVSTGQVALALVESCGDSTTELACRRGAAAELGGRVVRLRRAELAPGVYPLYAYTSSATPVALRVEIGEPGDPEENETCGTAASLGVGETIVVPVGAAEPDVPSACDLAEGELVYSIELDAPADLGVDARSLDGVGEPVLALLENDCVSQDDELLCVEGDPTRLFARGLAAGTYHLAVSASAPTDVEVTVGVAPPTEPLADEVCTGAPEIELHDRVDVDLQGHANDIAVGCLPGAADAAREFTVNEASDVLLVHRLSDDDEGAVALARPPCRNDRDLLACESTTRSPARVAVRGIAAGSHRVVLESERANPGELTVFARPATPPVQVIFADQCDDAFEIPESGGRFVGNTANASADYDAGCDLGSQPAGGAPEQMLELELSERRRVVFDMRDSAYQTLLNVRRGPACPGEEVLRGCAAGFVSGKSFLDLTLDAGQYFVQVDGYAGATGPWTLDVFTAPP